MLSPPPYMSPQEDINHLDLLASQKGECMWEKNMQETINNVALTELPTCCKDFFTVSTVNHKRFWSVLHVSDGEE